jgi:hypothetical protein
MTMPRRDGFYQDGFRKWVQENPRLDSVRNGLVVTDFDLLFHKYKTHTDKISTRSVQHMMVVEYKRHGAKLPPTQRDTLGMFHQIFRARRRVVKSPLTGCEVTLRFWGVHVLRFEGESPNDSKWMIWDKQKINLYDLEQLLRFEINPFNLMPIADRRHHKLGSDGYAAKT